MFKFYTMRLGSLNLALQQLLLIRLVVELLLEFSQSVSQFLNERLLINYKLSQGDIANMAGAARENVSRVLNDWKRAGTISRISGYYCIEHRDRLEKASAV